MIHFEKKVEKIAQAKKHRSSICARIVQIYQANENSYDLVSFLIFQVFLAKKKYIGTYKD